MFFWDQLVTLKSNQVQFIGLNRKEKPMKHREPTKPSVDKAIFHHTANKTKKVNIAPRVMRGGIRFWHTEFIV